jgi:anti-anti-sigma regulatory factor
MKLFERQTAENYIIEKVRICEPSFTVVSEFKKQLESDIESGCLNIILDLSNCESLNPAFIGVIVVTWKKLYKLGGTIKVVKPGLFTDCLLNFTGTIEIFERYDSLEKAIYSLNCINTNVSEKNSNEFTEFAIAQ